MTKKILIFLGFFAGFVLFFFILEHNFETKSGGPHSYAEIMKEWPYWIFSGLIFAGIATPLWICSRKNDDEE